MSPKKKIRVVRLTRSSSRPDIATSESLDRVALQNTAQLVLDTPIPSQSLAENGNLSTSTRNGTQPAPTPNYNYHQSSASAASAATPGPSSSSKRGRHTSEELRHIDSGSSSEDEYKDAEEDNMDVDGYGESETSSTPKYKGKGKGPAPRSEPPPVESDQNNDPMEVDDAANNGSNLPDSPGDPKVKAHDTKVPPFEISSVASQHTLQLLEIQQDEATKTGIFLLKSSTELKRGTVLFSENPLMKFTMRQPGSRKDFSKQQWISQKASFNMDFDNLTADQKKDFADLNWIGTNDVLGRVQANHHVIRYDKGKRGSVMNTHGIWYVISLPRHSCKPTALIDLFDGENKEDSDLGLVQLISTVNIKNGTEITVDRLLHGHNLFRTSTERQNLFRSQMSGEDCGCSVCNKPADQLQADDVERERLHKLWTKLQLQTMQHPVDYDLTILNQWVQAAIDLQDIRDWLDANGLGYMKGNVLAQQAYIWSRYKKHVDKIHPQFKLDPKNCRLRRNEALTELIALMEDFASLKTPGELFDAPCFKFKQAGLQGISRACIDYHAELERMRGAAMTE